MAAGFIKWCCHSQEEGCGSVGPGQSIPGLTQAGTLWAPRRESRPDDQMLPQQRAGQCRALKSKQQPRTLPEDCSIRGKSPAIGSCIPGTIYYDYLHPADEGTEAQRGGTSKATHKAQLGPEHRSRALSPQTLLIKCLQGSVF